jgi:hypothetical protein
MTYKRTSLCVVSVVTGLVALLAAGCVDTNFSSPIGGDKDGDGYTVDVDCDDEDPEINPAAPEAENCRDDNCDGKVDEGTPNADIDGDGFCPSTGDIDDCEGNPLRHPGMSEDGGDGSQEPNGIDDNCNGEVDENLPTSDMDKDGFTQLDGDCNDKDPNINPGAIEVEGLVCKANEDCPNGKCFGGYCRCAAKEDCSSNKTCADDKECMAGETCIGNKCASTYLCEDAVQGMSDPTLKVCRDKADNDCDGKIDEMPSVCDDPGKLSQANPYDYARAMELCDIDLTCGVEKQCPAGLKCESGYCTRLLKAAFDTGSDPKARAIDKQFAKSGPFVPKMGQSFVILSSGLAVYDPMQTCPQSGTDFGNTASDPDPNASDPDANDYVHLELEILVPTNAQSFSFDFHFFSTEYPEWVGSAYNDTFWVELTSQKFNGNISFDSKGTPIRINNAFFEICDPDPSLPPMCKQSASVLNGTGYYTDCTSSYGEANGGSTGWLQTTSPVTPGETIKLVFSIFDKGDWILDSAVLIDNFRWKLAPASKPQTGPD